MVWTLLLACTQPADTAGCSPSWDPWGHSFFVQWCDACHAETTPNRYGAPEGVTFDTERQVLEQVDRVQARVLDQQDMPPGSPIDADELALLQDWLDCESE
jgi:uncharacterized membrane protein